MNCGQYSHPQPRTPLPTNSHLPSPSPYPPFPPLPSLPSPLVTCGGRFRYKPSRPANGALVRTPVRQGAVSSSVLRTGEWPNPLHRNSTRCIATSQWAVLLPCRHLRPPTQRPAPAKAERRKNNNKKNSDINEDESSTTTKLPGTRT